MERITNINQQRIAWCCDDLGVLPDQVAKELGLSPAKLKAVIDGDGGLTFAQLRALAEYFGRSVLFFLEQGPVDREQVHSPQFRTLAGQKPDLPRRVRNLVRRVEQQRSVYLNLIEDIEGAERPRFESPAIPDSPTAAARIAREWLGLEESNDFDSFRKAVEDRGVLVFRTNGYPGKWQIAKKSSIMGFALYDPVMPVIVVRKQKAESMQSFTLMHELGHILLHRASSVDDDMDFRETNGMEREANRFAAHMLVSDSQLSTLLAEERPTNQADLDEWLKPYRNSWGASADVILLRLVEAGRMQQAAYDAFRAWRRDQHEPEADDHGSRAYRYREPRHVFGDRYVRTVLDALSAQQITLNKASDYLDGLKVKDLHRLEQFYAGA